jgi:hypothetical protein
VRRAVPSIPHVCWRVALSLAVLIALAVDAAEPVGAQATTSDSDSQSTVTYRITVDAPSPLKETLTREVGLVRWQGYAEMTEDLLDRLAREAIDETRNFAAAEGYFNAAIDVRIDRTTTPISVTLDVKTARPRGLHPCASKSRLRRDRRSARHRSDRDHPARLGTSRRGAIPATGVDAREGARAQHAHRKSLRGGANRAQRSVDRPRRGDGRSLHRARERTGIPLRHVRDHGPFEIRRVARAQLQPDRAGNAVQRRRAQSLREAPERVRLLRERAGEDRSRDHAPRGRDRQHRRHRSAAETFRSGVGYSTDVQWRTNASYRDVNFDGQGTQFLADARLESRIQSGSVKFQRPPTDFHWIATYFAGAERTDIESLVTRTAAFGTRWNSIDERDQRAMSATYFIDEQQPAGAPKTTANALYAEYEWYWRRVDDLLAPTKGYMLGLFAGVGVPGVSTRTFGRVRGEYAAWFPLTKDSEINLRAEAGAVLAGSRDGIPSKLLFRTGGSTTVRGYDFESLGVRVGDAIVPGRYYAVASVDAIRWIDSFWGIGVFVDAGNAIDSLSDAHLAIGYGVGARVRTPLGPFRLDVAYGQDVHQVRVQFSVGLTF